LDVDTALETNAAGAIELGRYDDAMALLDEASRIKAANGVKSRTTRTNYNVLVRVRLALAQGHLETARSLLDELFVDPAETSAVSFTALDRDLAHADVELAAGNPAAAQALAAAARERIERSGQAAYLGMYTLRSDFTEGLALLEAGKPAMAAPLLQRALAAREKMLAPASAKIAEADIALARCDLAMGDIGRAQSLAAAASAIHAAHKDLGEHYRAPLRDLQAALAQHRG